MENIKRQKLVPLKSLTREANIKRLINLSIEVSVLLATIGMGIYYIVIGDPRNRLMSCVGTFVAFLAPLIIEIIRGKRFTFFQHLIYDFYMFTSMFMGMVIFLHHSFAPYDEIMHVIFGYFACLAIFYGFMSTKAMADGKLFSAIAIFFFISMGTAALWECMEFIMDALFGENSLGFPPQGIIDYIKENNMTGIEANLYSLRYTSVIDTATDMVLHLGGTVIFIAQYFIHKHWNRNLLLGSLVKEWNLDEMNTPMNGKDKYNTVDKSATMADEKKEQIIDSGDQISTKLDDTFADDFSKVKQNPQQKNDNVD